MKRKMVTAAVVDISSRIVTIREQRVILDVDLAKIYGVETKTLNKAVKRNEVRFPADFCFQVTQEEFEILRYQNGTSSGKHGGRRYRPYAFTEQGAIMAATILNSPRAVHPRAVQMSMFVVRAFVEMRAMIVAQKELAGKLAALEKTLTERLDLHERVISDIIQQITSLLTPPPEPEPEPPSKQIGFHMREAATSYALTRSRK